MQKGVHGQSHVTDIAFRGQILELKLFFTYFHLLSNFLFKICTSIRHMVLNPSTPKGSPFDEQNRLALDRVKSIKSLFGVKGLREIVFLTLSLPRDLPLTSKIVWR